MSLIDFSRIFSHWRTLRLVPVEHSPNWSVFRRTLHFGVHLQSETIVMKIVSLHSVYWMTWSRRHRFSVWEFTRFSDIGV